MHTGTSAGTVGERERYLAGPARVDEEVEALEVAVHDRRPEAVQVHHSLREMTNCDATIIEKRTRAAWMASCSLMFQLMSGCSFSSVERLPRWQNSVRMCTSLFSCDARQLRRRRRYRNTYKYRYS
jgi:hypothetical protein